MREQAIAAHRAAVGAYDEAVEAQRRLAAAIQRRRGAPDEGPGSDRRIQLQAQIATERSQVERAERERQQREAQLQRLRAGIARDQALMPQIASIQVALQELAAAIVERKLAYDRTSPVTARWERRWRRSCAPVPRRRPRSSRASAPRPSR